MKRNFSILLLTLFIFLSIGSNESYAEWVSPGELVQSHKDMEGIDYCLKCHSLVNGLTDSACKNCHEKLLKRLNNNKGFHTNVQGKCFNCHTDHKGKDHDIVWIDKDDKDKFDHKLTGFALLDKHSTLKCEDCHKGKKTFLDLPSFACINCHMDVHKETSPKDCVACHDFKGWPVAKFDHGIGTEYQLTGKHAEVKCEPCHYFNPIREKDPKTDKVYRIIKFKPKDHKKCDNCHYDVHRDQFAKQDCINCHLLKQGWKGVTFKHESAKYMGYKLDNKHKDVQCDKCHERSEIIFTEFGKEKKALLGLFKPIESKKCSDCHYDVHMAQFEKQDCADCHPINNDWKKMTFKHNSPDYSGFKLEGRHIEVLCDKCHKRSEITYTEFKKERKTSVAKYKPITSNVCNDCHEDKHKGKYKEILQVDTVDCKKCHSLERDWKIRVYEHIPKSKYHKYVTGGQGTESACDECHVCSTDIFCITCCFENTFKRK